jgi:hemerythrin
MESRYMPDGLERWWQEHSELGELVDATAEALRGGSIASAAQALDDLHEALEAHFGLEETLYFPLVARHSPEMAPSVEAARLGHDRIRARLEDLRALVDDGDLRGARAALEGLLEKFRAHEAEETKLIVRLEQLAAAS